ncbi:MAG TPA: quinolinate synthase NadA [Candidatus Cloacimonadota bacterium]|nr:quinolinate synthase NadA [Candidatus Cloacimonadota bacterium]
MQKMLKEIQELRKQKNAVILAHNYQPTEIIELADFMGDSLQLALKAKEVSADILVFCGVRFMAETAAILNPQTKVLLPAQDAGCPMADMVTAEQLIRYKQEHPDTVIVCYVNSSVEVKAESDICCTSANAVQVLASIPEDKEVLFVPDRNLGSWAAKQLGRTIHHWPGYCPVHQWSFDAAQVKNMRKRYPDHLLLAHPECDEDIVDVADEVMSTGGMLKRAAEIDKMIIATEKGLPDYLKKIYPQKSIVHLSPKAVCKNMKKITISHVLDSLRFEQYEVKVDADIAARAVKSLDRMLELSR